MPKTNENQSMSKYINKTNENQSMSKLLKLEDLTEAKWKIRKLSDDELEAIAGGLGCVCPDTGLCPM